MCLAIPGRVKSIEGRLAVIEYPEEERKAMIAEENVKVGDFVMVQMGCVVRRLSKEEAPEVGEAWGENNLKFKSQNSK